MNATNADSPKTFKFIFFQLQYVPIRQYFLTLTIEVSNQANVFTVTIAFDKKEHPFYSCFDK